MTNEFPIPLISYTLLLADLAALFLHKQFFTHNEAGEHGDISAWDFRDRTLACLFNAFFVVDLSSTKTSKTTKRIATLNMV